MKNVKRLLSMEKITRIKAIKLMYIIYKLYEISVNIEGIVSGKIKS